MKISLVLRLRKGHAYLFSTLFSVYVQKGKVGNRSRDNNYKLHETVNFSLVLTVACMRVYHCTFLELLSMGSCVGVVTPMRTTSRLYKQRQKGDRYVRPLDTRLETLVLLYPVLSFVKKYLFCIVVIPFRFLLYRLSARSILTISLI
jgi:hypothetical protein